MPRRQLLAARTSLTLTALVLAGVLGAPCFTVLRRPARFSATPVSDDSSDAVNQVAREELESIGAKDVRFMDQRWYFDATSNFDVLRLRDVRHVQSVRSIVLLADLGEDGSEVLLDVIKRGNWKALEDLAPFLPGTLPWCCRAAARGAAKRRWPNGTQDLEAALHRRFGWPIQKPGRLADVTVHMQLFRNKLLLEVALLKQRRPILGGGWPHRGLGHVEAWALARSLDLKADEVVLDPMCGKGTLLAEVATWWPSTRLIGVDVDPQQLQRCRENFHWLQREVSLQLANVTEDGLAAVGMVDRVLVAPPWNKQFVVPGELQDFFEGMFRAIFQVLKPDGKLVLLGSRGQVEKSLLMALGASQSHHRHHLNAGEEAPEVRWKVVARQRFALTPRTTATVLLVELRPLQDATPAARHLPWDRVTSESPVERWRRQRAGGFPRLVPANLGDAEPVRDWRPPCQPCQPPTRRAGPIWMALRRLGRALRWTKNDER